MLGFQCAIQPAYVCVDNRHAHTHTCVQLVNPAGYIYIYRVNFMLDWLALHLKFGSVHI